MTTELSRWQRPDGFPTDDYFAAVEAALAERGVAIVDSWRDEDWEYTLQLWDEEDPPTCGPMSWATHGLFISWRCDEMSEPQHADDFGTLVDDVGWYWVPYTKPGALGDFTESFGLRYLAEPDEVAEAIHQLVTTGTRAAGDPPAPGRATGPT